jgi:PDZ domain-containing secreted protein
MIKAEHEDNQLIGINLVDHSVVVNRNLKFSRASPEFRGLPSVGDPTTQ